MNPAADSQDVLLRVRGVVQGVGFRPFVHGVARELGLRGWVRNDAQGVLIRAAGSRAVVAALIERLAAQAPPAAQVLSVAPEVDLVDAPPAGDDFAIVASGVPAGTVDAAIPPDLALCAACRTELLSPDDRRRGYPFINCTQCGPRYSIIERLPYDRPQTTMRAFRMCPACRREYDDPQDRRFHAQPNACAQCGPTVTLVTPAGRPLAEPAEAIRRAAELIAAGLVVAVKGIGGYHLCVDATNERAVAELRRRKQRDEKPFAVLFRDLAAVEAVASVSAAAVTLLSTPAAPIVLVPQRPGSAIAANVAPHNPWLGAMLAYAPLHVLLLQELGRPVVATSGNLAEEPLCTDVAEAHDHLGPMADAFLDHDRPIAHPVDDSVVRLATSAPVLLRRARGYAPVPLALPAKLDGQWLCLGGQMKNVVGVAADRRVVLSPHIGDLAGAATRGAFQRTIAMLAQLHRTAFTAVACDKHPDYASTRHAQSLGLPVKGVQHHLAHVLACLLEHGHAADGVLGVALDGTGYGEDGTVWGGEFFILERRVARRFARVRPFGLAGGEAAVRDPRRSALGLLHATEDVRLSQLAAEFGFTAPETGVLRAMLARGLNSPMTSSAGRLFDAVGALLGVGDHNAFEGQAALAVEAAAMRASSPAMLPLPVRPVAGGRGAVCEIDWAPLVDELMRRRGDDDSAALAAGFHVALARAITQVARRAGIGTAALSGGCFQNVRLFDLTVAELSAAGFRVLTHRQLPPNDGNLAAGQAYAALLNLSTVAMP